MRLKKFAGLVVVIGILGACREALTANDLGELDLREAQAPCEGCTLAVPYTSQAAPLLVVLHGDHETAKEAAERWVPTAATKGWAVLALQCPSKLGCDDMHRWYMWNGDPAWVKQQVDEVAAQHAIDPRRVYLVGWSGGASYIGQFAQQWGDRFAAVVFHGGGQPPTRGACPSVELPTYFLVGDKNRTHATTRELRAWFERCKQPVTWDLLAGANHKEEAAALDRVKAAAIVAWLEAHPRESTISSR